MYTRILLVVFFTNLFFSSCQAQKLTTKESSQLQSTIHLFFSNSAIGNNSQSNKPELFICILRIDASGKIASLNLLSDASNHNAGFLILSKLSLEDFKDWKSDLVKDKTVVIPISVFGDIEPSKYIGSFLSDFYKMGNTSDNMVNIPGVNLYWPQTMKTKIN